MNEMKLQKAITDRTEDVISFVERILKTENWPLKMQLLICMVVEEIYVNIAKYAYSPKTGPASIQVEMEKDPPAVVITFTDRGIPYNPLAKPDPDVTLPAEMRQIGGLGIFMVKKSVDDITYERKDGQNILRIRKNLRPIQTSEKTAGTGSQPKEV